MSKKQALKVTKRKSVAVNATDMPLAQLFFSYEINYIEINVLHLHNFMLIF